MNQQNGGSCKLENESLSTGLVWIPLPDALFFLMPTLEFPALFPCGMFPLVFMEKHSPVSWLESVTYGLVIGIHFWGSGGEGAIHLKYLCTQERCWCTPTMVWYAPLYSTRRRCQEILYNECANITHPDHTWPLNLTVPWRSREERVEPPGWERCDGILPYRKHMDGRKEETSTSWE